MFTFSFEDRIKFTETVYYHFHKIPLPKPLKDGTGGIGKFAPEQGCIELYDQEGVCAHLAVGPGFIADILPMVLNGEGHSYNEWRNSLHWKIRSAGFQSEKAVEVGQPSLMMPDILAQREGGSLHRFVGANKGWAQAYRGGGSLLLEDHELIEDMVRYVEEGYATVKFKVGNQNDMDMKRDLHRIEMVRKVVEGRVGAAADCDQRWGVDNAFRFTKLRESHNLTWLEKPIHSHDMNGVRRLKNTGMVVPTTFKEPMRIYYECEAYVEKGVDHVQPSLGRMARMDDIIRTRDLAHKKGAKFTSGGRVYLNAIFGCLYSEDERVEYHKLINCPVGVYTLFQPEEKSRRFYCQPELPGNPQRMSIGKLEKNGFMENREVYYPKNWQP